MCHLSLTQLLFIARLWNEVFSFPHVLPGLETSERKGDISNEGYVAHNQKNKNKKKYSLSKIKQMLIPC